MSVLAVAPAQAVVIDFESMTHSGTFTTSPGNSYTENGFTMTNSGTNGNDYITWGTAMPFYSGSTTLGHHDIGTTTTFTQVGGGAFSQQIAGSREAPSFQSGEERRLVRL